MPFIAKEVFLVDPERIQQLLKDLNHNKYPVRGRASAELGKYGRWIEGVLREALKALTFRRHGGASTIDMQFVRTKTGFKQRTLQRKSYEMLLAFLLQFRMEKHAILETIRQLKGDKLMAAKLLGIGKTTLYRKLKEYGITEAGGEEN